MRKYLIRLLERSLPEAPCSEDFFLAGPPATSRQRGNAVRQQALFAEVRRQQLHGPRALAP